MESSSLWFFYAVVTMLFWGVWGAFIERPEKNGFPATLGYAVWAFTMVPCAAVALAVIGWVPEHDLRSVVLGSVAGLLGAAGQLVLFDALRRGPAYLVFPVISLSPVVSVLLSVLLLGETASPRAWTGIVLALLAMPLLSYQPPSHSSPVRGRLWFVLALLVFLAWGIQAYVLRFANATMRSESIFFYMMLTALLLVPIAVWMTDFTKPVNWGLNGPWLAAPIQLLNSIGALTMVYAFRHGKVIIVSPMINALAPVITIVLSLLLYRVVPHRVVVLGMALAAVAFYLMS
ncbi:MAG TPA: EamA family transporter [Vicinamibacteria bacterium]|nr:EamA family transporter [Vicinamibacteria bacterium]